jgi:hypothetical protein
MGRPRLHSGCQVPGTKVCKDCGTEKDTTDFSFRPVGHMKCRTVCKECQRKRDAAHFQELKATGKYRDFRRKQTLLETGTSSAEYAALLLMQKGVCLGCGSPPADGDSLCVDHDHSMELPDGTIPREAVRGLLCRSCNLATGNAHDDPACLEALAANLRRHQLMLTAKTLRLIA